MTLLALTLVALSTTHPPKAVAEVRPRTQTEERLPQLPRLAPEQREWLEHAIEHILKGE